MKFELLKKLSEIPGISGFEEPVADFIEEEIKGKVDNYWRDSVGNLIALKKGKGENTKKLMLLAHMDEVGLMISKINKDGTLGITRVGGVDPRVLIGKKVLVGKDLLEGVIGFKAIHLQSDDSLFKAPDYKNLSIYAGFNSKEEASGKVKVGDPVYFNTQYEEVGHYALGKAFDDRSGCVVLLEVLKALEDISLEHDVYFSWVVQEEVGLRGSGVAASQVVPDAAIVFENTTAGDNPEIPESRWATRLGEGPALTFAHGGLVLNRRIFDVIKATAERHDIPYQYKARLAGGTDAARLARVLSGIPSGVISTPSRYIHSPVSMIDTRDFSAVIELAKILVIEGKVLPE
ncbi:peptidase M42 [Kosmotoga arenicorallina S304]|uniref:Peptidase M42 n=1 Tax=Kosmotoga arenicorallina S304 TaxID=1453497 RepID=A0A176K4C2_9BACT|nr:M42 family metallopeptidase [Kosmotoga arenicorallina]OAA31931.1 peptidase M42 [Kosmotoga arenicorallina S304]